jgi:hypothetical protein
MRQKKRSTLMVIGLRGCASEMCRNDVFKNMRYLSFEQCAPDGRIASTLGDPIGNSV